MCRAHHCTEPSLCALTTALYTGTERTLVGPSPRLGYHIKFHSVLVTALWSRGRVILPTLQTGKLRNGSVHHFPHGMQLAKSTPGLKGCGFPRLYVGWCVSASPQQCWPRATEHKLGLRGSKKQAKGAQPPRSGASARIQPSLSPEPTRHCYVNSITRAASIIENPTE